jgi:two-component system, OmpR family, sensor kinase
MLGGSTLFKQTLLTLIGALFLVHLVLLLAVILLPHAGSDTATIGDITLQLARADCPGGSAVPERLGGLSTRRQAQPPQPVRGMTTDSGLVEQVADALGVPNGEVRIFWRAGSDISLNRPTTVTVNGRSHRLNQTLFLGGAVFARQGAEGWCVHTVPPPGASPNWKWRTIYLIAVSLLAMLPLAWLFARRLSRPIRDFATASDRIGRDSHAPALEETGPDELRLASRALNEMQRGIQAQFREREAMVAAIAHDLRTPLSRIAFRVEALPPEVRDPVQRDVEQMKAMIAATLEYTRGLHAGRDTDTVDLGELLAQLVEEERELGSDVSLTAPAEPAPVEGDAIEFNRLFQNLVDNARKFAGAVEIELTVGRDAVTATVADRGPGIAPDQLEGVFTPFVRGEPSRNRETGGMGLGLPIARAIARRYGGELVLSNRLGGGLIAEVTLPRSKIARRRP